MKPVICDETGKRTYVSREAAMRARKRYRKKKSNAIFNTEKNVRGYQCEFCCGWHNTSMPLDEYRRVVRKP